MSEHSTVFFLLSTYQKCLETLKAERSRIAAGLEVLMRSLRIIARSIYGEGYEKTFLENGEKASKYWKKDEKIDPSTALYICYMTIIEYLVEGAEGADEVEGYEKANIILREHASLLNRMYRAIDRGDDIDIALLLCENCGHVEPKKNDRDIKCQICGAPIALYKHKNSA